MIIREATDFDQHLWDSYVLTHPEGTAYHLFAWGKAIERAYQFQKIYLLAEDKGKICGIFPLIDFRGFFLSKRLVSLPYCDSGGLLADGDEVIQALLKEALAVAKEKGLACSIRSTFPLLFAGENQTDKVRMVLSLPANSEEFLASLKSKLRSQVKKPLRDGLTVNLGSQELVFDFYKIFSENMRDLGSPVHGLQWIKEIIELYNTRVRLAVVYMPDGTPAAAGIILLHTETAVIPWASSLRRYNRWNPNMLLYWTFLQFAADNGYKQFDFGRSTPGEGTWRFKEQWGALPQKLFWYELNEKKNPSSKKHKISRGFSHNRQLIAFLWSKLPVKGANWLGPRIRKYISL